MNTISRSEEIPVAYETDVLVVGGGPAGLSAAFTAAKMGRSVLIVEQMNCLGGIATAGMHGHICVYNSWHDFSERVVGGTCYELADRLTKDGYATFNNRSLFFEVERMKYLLECMAKELNGNLKLLYYTQFSDVVVDDNEIAYVIIQNKSGRQAIKPKIVIDCTGDADVCARAGVPYEKGKKEDGTMQPMTLMFQIGGVDHDTFEEFETKGYMERYGLTENNSDYELWKEAQENGDMEPFQTKTMGWWWCATRPDQLGVNFTHINHVDATNAEDLTYATIEGRRQAYASLEVFRKYMPGLEHAWMSHTGALIGTRESRRIAGEYKIKAEDLLNEREFDDSIGYGSFFIDIHNCSGPGMDKDMYRPHKGFKYQIPYRALLPKNIDNLIAAGRCISCDHIALGSLRVMPQCFIEGDAAGCAAALSLKDNKTPKTIDTKVLQKNLREHVNAIISSDDIVHSE